jgi:L-iditol 2-dehydrogenase
MRAAVLRADRSLTAEEWPRPDIGEGELLLRLRGCGLCGSDIAKIAAPPTSRPTVVGHEVVGDVVAVGEGAPFAVGERVVAAHHVPCGDCHYCRRGSASMCRAFKASNLDPGGFAEFVRVPADNARHATFALPPHMSDEAASFVEPLACCLRAVKRARVEAGDTAVVVGLGSIGCLFLQLLKRWGAFTAGADVLPARTLLGADVGADAAGDAEAVAAAVRGTSAGRGADHVFVTGGGAAVLPWAAATVRDGGAIHFFAGGGGDALPLSLSALYHRELTVTATYSSSPLELREAFELIAAGAVRTARLISHRVPLARLAEGVALVESHEALKVYVTP